METKANKLVLYKDDEGKTQTHEVLHYNLDVIIVNKN